MADRRYFFAMEHQGILHKMFSFYIGDGGEGLALVSPPKYSAVDEKRCVIQKWYPKRYPNDMYKLEVKDAEFVTSKGGIALKVDPSSNNRTLCEEMQAELVDIKMNWHPDGNFHISGHEIPNRTKSSFIGKTKDYHSLLYCQDSISGNVECVEILILGVIYIENTNVFINQNNILRTREQAIFYPRDNSHERRPTLITIARAHARSPNVLQVRSGLNEMTDVNLQRIMEENIENLYLPNYPIRIKIDKSRANMFAARESGNNSTSFIFHACQLTQNLPLKENEDWFVVSSVGKDGEALGFTIKKKSGWWPN